MTKLNILLVEDSAVIRKKLKLHIEKLDYKVTEVADGEEAFKCACQNQFDLVITDVDMPVKNGLQLCKDLRDTSSTKSLPVIMVSDFDSEDDISKGFEAGASAYLPKSEVLERLQEQITNVLASSSFRSVHTILIVEDTPTIRKAIKYGLIQAGFKVLTASNGKEAIDMLRKKKVNLILSDIEMPEMDGFALCRQLKADSDLHEIPIVIMSTHSERSYMKRVVELGAATYLVKPFNPEELIIIIDRILSDQFQILLHETKRLENERQMMLASITSLVHALEARDAYTRGHSEGVAEITAGMVRLTGASESEIETALIGGRLHDIGKIGVKDSVLLKDGKLTSEEYEHIKAHPVIGANILKAIESLAEIIPICLHHHERFDGKGYPDGLKGEEIPLVARMAAVADTFNAMTSDRPYRKGMPQAKAVSIIQEVSGTQLCPEAVNLFMQWLGQQT
nr:response regulator [Desulfobulbaceae bacterium]